MLPLDCYLPNSYLLNMDLFVLFLFHVSHFSQQLITLGSDIFHRKGQLGLI